MHTLILGITASGKSFLARLLCRQFRKHSRTLAVLNPIGDRWPADWQTDDPELFLAYCRNHPQLTIFVDESGDVFEHYRSHLNWLATRGRHWGHACFFIAQRAAQIPKTVRDNCTTLYLFASSRSDADVHAEEWNRPELRAAPELPRGHFFRTGRFEAVEYGIIHFRTASVRLRPITSRKVPGS